MTKPKKPASRRPKRKRSQARLTAKQERFAQLVASGYTQADAYRGAYDCGRMSGKTISECASRLAQDRKVTAMVRVLRQPEEKRAKKAVDRALDAHLLHLSRLRNKAEHTKSWDAAIRAEISIGVACGHYPKNVNIRGNFDHRHQVDSEPVSDTLQWLEEVGGADPESQAPKPLPH